MRQWMVDPEILCQKHLCGEHVEHHMFIGTLRKKIKVDGYLENNLFEPRSLYERHKALAEEMVKRGYNHNSPLREADCSCVLNLTTEQQYWEIDKTRAFEDLISRCPECEKRYREKERE